MCIKIIVKGCCDVGGWFEMWRDNSHVAASNNNAEARYGVMFPVNWEDEKPVFNSFTAFEISTLPSDPVISYGACYAAGLHIWIIETRAGGVYLTNYQDSGTENSTQLVTDFYTFGPPEEFLALTRYVTTVQGIPGKYKMAAKDSLVFMEDGDDTPPVYIEYHVTLYPADVRTFTSQDVFDNPSDFSAPNGPFYTFGHQYKIHTIAPAGTHTIGPSRATQYAITEPIKFDQSVDAQPGPGGTSIFGEVVHLSSQFWGSTFQTVWTFGQGTTAPLIGCSVRCNEVAGMTVNQPTWTESTNAMFMEMRVGDIVTGDHYYSIEGDVVVRVDYDSTYTYFNSTAEAAARQVLPIKGQWHWFDALGSDDWAAILQYDNRPLYLPTLVGPDDYVNNFPSETARVAKVRLTNAGHTIREWTVATSDFGDDPSPGISLGIPYCLHPFDDGGTSRNRYIAVVMIVYDVEPTAEDPIGVVTDPSRPYAFRIYNNADLVWSSPLLLNAPTFCGSTDRWVYFEAPNELASYMTSGVFQDSGDGKSGFWLVKHDGSEIVPAGALTDDPTIVSIGPYALFSGLPAVLTADDYGFLPHSDQFALPATFAEMYALRYTT